MAYKRARTAEPGEASESWRGKQRRVHPYTPYVSQPKASSVLTRVLARVKAAFIKGGISTAGLTPMSVSFLVPPAVTEDGIDTILDICNGRQMLLDTEDIVYALNLRRVLPTDVFPPGTNSNYLRCFDVPTSLLPRMLAEWEEIKFYPVQAQYWLTFHSILAAQGQEWFSFRYFGGVDGPRSPLDRMAEDLARTSGLYGHFIRFLMRNLPTSVENSQVYTFADAMLPPYASRFHRDLRERIGMAFLGYLTLLNSQLGGTRPSFVPSLALIGDFQTAKTRTLRRLMDLKFALTPTDTALQANLATLWNRYSELGKSYREATRTDSYPWTKATRLMQVDQANPRILFHGGAPVICIGDDIPMKEYLSAKSFWDATLPAGALTLTLLDQIVKAEADSDTPISRTEIPQLFPMINLFPFVGIGELDRHMQLLRSYCEIVRPWVAVLFGKLVTACAASNFQHQYGIPVNSDNLASVGVPMLVSYADPAWTLDETQLEPPDDSYFLAVHHVHPGRDKYNHQPEAQRVVYFLTWVVTMILITVLFVELPALLARGLSRKGCLQEVLVVFNRRMSGSAIETRLNGAKAKLMSEWGKNAQIPREISDETRKAQSAAAMTRAARNGVAIGAPGSEERIAQTELLWKRKQPDLHLMIPHALERRQEWLDFFQNQVQEGQGFYYVMLYHMGIGSAENPLYHLLVRFPPPDATDDAWIDDDAECRAALGRLTAHMRSFLPADHFSSEKQRARAYLRRGTDVVHRFLPVMDGREVFVQVNGAICLYWRRGPNDEHSFRLSVPKVLASSDDRKRFLKVVPDGLTLVDEFGIALTTLTRSGTLIPFSQLATHPQSALLQEMWRNEASRLALPLPATAAVFNPAYLPAGREPLRAPLKNGKSFGTVRPSDSQWLLQAFLNHEFPHGSHNAKYIPTTRDLKYPSIWLMFKNFLQGHRDHPHCQTWLDIFGDTTRMGKVLSLNMKLFRDIEVGSYRPGNGDKKQGIQTYKIGPPKL